MPRAYCVLVFKTVRDPIKNKIYGKYENFRVLLGKEEPLEEVKAVIDEKITGSFDIVRREQEIPAALTDKKKKK